MRNRVLEILAAAIGVAVVVALYLGREEPAGSDAPALNVTPWVEDVESQDPATRPRPAAPAARSVLPDSRPDIDLPVPVDPALETAELTWEAARAELDQVQTELERLDSAFDAKEAEFAALEAQGTDAAVIEEQMLIYLDGMVDEYDALETRLAEAEASERAAAEALSMLRGGPADQAPD